MKTSQIVLITSVICLLVLPLTLFYAVKALCGLEFKEPEM